MVTTTDACKIGKVAKNKGTVAMKFKVDETTLAFLSCHLAENHGEALKRAEILQSLMHEVFIKTKNFAHIDSHFVGVVMGSLNF